MADDGLQGRGFRLDLGGTYPYSDDAPQLESLAWYQRLNPLQKAYKEKERGWRMSPLPIPLETYTNAAGNLEKVPITQFSWRYLRDLTYTSDLLSLIVRTKTQETFRNGIDVSPRFQSKCESCGREFEEEKLVCPFDGGMTKLPDYEQWKLLNGFLQGTNRWDESVLTVMKEVDFDLHVGDNGFIYLEHEYEFGEDGRLARGDVVDIIRFDPNMIRMIYSRYGMGTTESGTFTYFCPTHRQEVVERAEPGDHPCEKCGKQMFQAWYSALTKAERIYYGPREIFHVKMYANSQGYGVSPIMAVYMKVNALIRMDKFILEAYSLQRAPQELLILRGKKDSIQRSWEYLMQKARENPNMVYPLVIEGDEQSKNRVIEHETFALKPIEWAWGEMRQEFRDVVGRVYGVQPIFSTGASTAGGGLANEGLQLAVTTLAIKKSQETWNTFLEFLSRQLGADDYRLKLNPNEQEDELRDLEVVEKRIGVAQAMRTLGYGVEMHKDSKGRLDFSYKEQLVVEQDPTNEAVPEDEEEVAPEEEGAPPAEEKEIPPLRDPMTPEQDLRSRQAEARRKNETKPVPTEYGGGSGVTASLDKNNYKSAPGGKMRRNPTGAEDATPQNVVDTQDMTILEGRGGT